MGFDEVKLHAQTHVAMSRATADYAFWELAGFRAGKLTAYHRSPEPGAPRDATSA